MYVISLTKKKYQGADVDSSWYYRYKDVQNADGYFSYFEKINPDSTSELIAAVNDSTSALDGRIIKSAKYPQSTFLGDNRYVANGFLVWWDESAPLKSAEYQYAYGNNQAFLNKIGLAPNKYVVSAEGLQSIKRSSIKEGGVEWISATEVFDYLARPLTVRKNNSLGHEKVDVTEYHDNFTLWVIGQVKRQYVTNASPNAGAASGGMVVFDVEYSGQALPSKIYHFGKLQQTLAYNTDGTLATVADGRGNITTLSNWKRGIPQLIRYPATPEAPAGATVSATVDDNGWITSVTDENNYVTGYGYDAMGRLASVVYPSGDGVAYHNDLFSFQPLTDADWKPANVSTGQWRRFEVTANRTKITYFDALWRPVLVHEYDAANVGPTLRSVRTEYDASGRVSFQSYPTSDVIPGASGMRTFYDALDRVTRVEQDSELGVLATTTEYLPGLRTRVTNPRNQQVTTSFMAWDQPNYELPILSEQPEGKVIRIDRHPQFGWPLALTQRNAADTLSATRRYVYDGHAQLCKTIEPETGATVTGYDAAGNPEWSAAGLTGGDYANPNDCSYLAASNSGRVTTRTHDPRNRLSQLLFPDGRGNQAWTYAPDSLPASITTYNGPGNTEPVVMAYTYNKRRLLTGESITQTNGGSNWYTWTIGYAYDAYGHLASQTYPTGLTVDYAPNPMGQATKAGSYASGAQYYPNGALKQFTYGNGIVHTMQQNARQLPMRVTATGNAMDYDYGYDANGNVERIYDDVTGTPTARHRWMGYDGLDRLTSVASAVFGGTDHTHRFTYDALDNLESWQHAGVKDYADYVYDAQNRLTNIRNTAGATVVGLSYDPQGNLQNKNGQIYDFDYGNHLRNVTAKESYRYDGLGRRVQTTSTTGKTTLWQYSQSGQMLFSSDWGGPDNQAQQTHENVYLAGSLIATIDHAWPSNAVLATKYQHTDALGSPVAVTNPSGQVIERMDYEPWGAIIGNPTRSGMGYTGHVMDGATGLTYMQQRYYDQSLGRFLSVDPVAVRKTGENFNRYAYAYENPYRYIDSDGRDGSPFSMSRADARIRKLEASDPKAARTAQMQGYAAATVILFGPLVSWHATMAALANPVTTTNVVVGAGEVAGVTGMSGAAAFQAFRRFPNLGVPGDQTGGALRFALNEIKAIPYSGRLNYVVMPSGEVVIGRGGHSLLSGGGDVLAAGEVKFVNGVVRTLNNASGHYRPSGDSARKAAESAFEAAGFPATGKYKEVKQ